MAINCTSSAQIPIQKIGSFFKMSNKDLMSKHSFAPLKKVPAVLKIRSSVIKTKVFEDKSQGIVCYKDETGKIICEGYDEGPRFSRFSRLNCNTRNVEIMNIFLQKGWLQIVQEEGMEFSDGVYMIDDLNFNHFFKRYW